MPLTGSKTSELKVFESETIVIKNICGIRMNSDHRCFKRWKNNINSVLTGISQKNNSRLL